MNAAMHTYRLAKAERRADDEAVMSEVVALARSLICATPTASVATNYR